MFDPKTTTDDYVFMIMTHDCNRNCKFCVDLKRGHGEFISLENVQKGIDYCLDNNIKTITMLGGEPLLYPKLVKACLMIKENDLNIVMTTNADRLERMKMLDEHFLINSFNVSHYNQKELPNKKDFNADLTLSKLLFKGGIDTKEKLDTFIDTYQNQFDDLKFSTLTNINEYTDEVKDLPFLDDLKIDRKVTIMGEIQGHYYRGYLIKRFDLPAIEKTYCKRSMKIHTNGEIKREW